MLCGICAQEKICVHCARRMAALTPTLCVPPLLCPSLHLPLVAGNIDESHDCRKSSHVSVKNQEQSGVTAVTSTPAIGTDGQPQLIHRIMKAAGTAHFDFYFSRKSPINVGRHV